LVNEGSELDFENFSVDLAAVCPTEGSLRLGGGSGVVEAYDPYVLYASDKCSTFDRDRDFYGRAQRKLLTAEAFFLEGALWNGITSNPFLADGAGVNNDTATQTLALTATSAKAAFAVLEQNLGWLSSSPGTIHLRPQVLHELLEARTVRRVGNVYLSPMDNIVIPGRGYPGTGPASEVVGATEWMYGHPGKIQVRRSEMVRLGEGDLASQVNRYVNDRIVFVQRVVHVALDSSKGVFAIEFNSIS
jgi:hypothetical protein